MGRKKKVKEVAKTSHVKPQKRVIQTLSVDYSNEGLNDMARKINEVIEEING